MNSGRPPTDRGDMQHEDPNKPSALRIAVALILLVFWGFLIWADKNDADWSMPFSVHLMAVIAVAYLFGRETVRAARGLLIGGNGNGSK